MGRTRTGASLAVLSLSVLLLCGTRVEAAQKAGKKDANGQLYVKYCGSCHGPDGKGNGILAGVLQTKPADLTQIAKKHGGEFPTGDIEMFIDGRTNVRAHGDPDMPVWGEVLSDQAMTSPGGGSARAEARRKIVFITEYIKSIQEK
jgi:mono/diheme cytochrome c family protein